MSGREISGHVCFPSVVMVSMAIPATPRHKRWFRVTRRFWFPVSDGMGTECSFNQSCSSGRCYPNTPIHNGFIDVASRRQRSSDLSRSAHCQGRIMVQVPGHIRSPGIGFPWRPGLSGAGAPQIWFHGLLCDVLAICLISSRSE